MKPSLRFAIYVLALGLITGCIDQTGLQRDYISRRDNCRSNAEHKLEKSRPDVDKMGDKEKNNALLGFFSECMKQYDWKVAGPKKDKDAKDKDAKDAAAPASYAPPPGFALVPVQALPAAVSTSPAAVRGAPAKPVQSAPPVTYMPKTAPAPRVAAPKPSTAGADELEKIINKDIDQ